MLCCAIGVFLDDAVIFKSRWRSTWAKQLFLSGVEYKTALSFGKPGQSQFFVKTLLGVNDL